MKDTDAGAAGAWGTRATVSVNPVIREYTEEDREQVAAVWSAAFRGGRPMPPEEELIEEGERGYVAVLEGRIVGAFTVHDMNATRGEALLRCGGVASVAVAAEYRHMGLGRAMMCWSLDRMRADGFALSSLYAFRESYYRLFGWECAGKRIRIKCPNQRLPNHRSSLPVRQMRAEDWCELEPAYLPFAKRYSGMNIRTPGWWLRLLTGGESVPVIYAAGEPTQAYAILRLAKEFWGDQSVSELVWATAEGYRSILAVLSGIGVNRSSMSWYEPSDGPFLSAWVDQGVETVITRPIMFRVNDVPAALGGLKPEAEGEFRMAIADEHLPANNGPWRVAFSKGGVCVERCDSADIEAHVRHFSQAVLGEPNFAQLLSQGFIQARCDSAAQSALRLLPARATYCLDFF